MKKIILFVIDALGSAVLVPAIDEGKLPHFQALADRGTFRKECISIFPSITPAALTAIITGKYPVESGIPGDYWYDLETETVSYFGSDFTTIMREGMETFLNDFLINLNARYLLADTLFETVEKNDLRAACLNLFVHRGLHDYEMSLPGLLNIFPSPLDGTKVKGPSLLHLGDLHHIDLDGFDASKVGGLSNRFGFKDDTTVAILKHLVEHEQLPDFTVAYMPDNDWDSHELGPHIALNTLIHVDELLGELFSLKDGVEGFLSEHIVLIVGDHSQSPLVEDDNKRGINLNQVLADYHLVDSGKGWSDDDEIIACPNLRATLFYFNEIDKNRFYRVVDTLLDDERIDQVIWRGKLLGILESGYYVQTAKHGRLFFRDDGDSPMAHDAYGGGWTWEGDLACVDGQVSDEGLMTFGDYPNAFERIKNVLDLERSGDVWATAKPGYTFHLDGMSYEPRGSHAALHRLDSTTSLIVAGHDEQITVPEQPRIVDVAPLVLEMLGVSE